MSPPINFEVNLQLEELIIVVGMFLHSGNSLEDIDDEVIYKLYSLTSKEAENREKLTKKTETVHWWNINLMRIKT